MAIAPMEIGKKILDSYNLKWDGKGELTCQNVRKNKQTVFKTDLEIIQDLETKGGGTRLDVPSDLSAFMTKAYKYVASKYDTGEKDELTEESFWEKHVCEYLQFDSLTKVTLAKAAEFDHLSSSLVGRTLSIPDVKSIVMKLYKQLSKKFTMPYDPQTMANDIERALPFYSQRKRNKLFESLRFSGKEDDSALRSILKDLKVDNLEADVKIVKHLIWCVKRKALGMETFNEVFPVFTGKGGTGKSQTILRLGSVLDSFFKPGDLEDISENRDNAMTSNHTSLVLFDEMARADRADINKLKSWVTATEIGVRMMRTNSRTYMEKLAQGIGTSNVPLRNLLADPTGNRRFFEIKIGLPAREAPEWMDYLKFPDYAPGSQLWISIWENVDEKKEDGYWNPQDDKDILEIMDRCVLPSNSKLWAEQYLPVIEGLLEKNEDPSNYVVFTPADELWEDFKDFEMKNRLKYQMTYERFKKEAEEALAEVHPSMVSEKKTVKGELTFGFYIVDPKRKSAADSAPKLKERT